MTALLQELSAHNRSLRVVTTRIAPTDLADCRETTAPVVTLGPLSPEAGAALLRARGVHGEDKELREASKEPGGHALAVYLLAQAYGGDVRKRDVVGRRDSGPVGFRRRLVAWGWGAGARGTPRPIRPARRFDWIW